MCCCVCITIQDCNKKNLSNHMLADKKQWHRILLA